MIEVHMPAWVLDDDTYVYKPTGTVQYRLTRKIEFGNQKIEAVGDTVLLVSDCGIYAYPRDRNLMVTSVDIDTAIQFLEELRKEENSP
jgi:hypothetical protein